MQASDIQHTLAQNDDKEEIRRQIDSIIAVMEQQIEAAKYKQTLIDKLIDATTTTSQQIVEMKDTAAQAQHTSTSRIGMLSIAGTAGVCVLTLLIYALH